MNKEIAALITAAKIRLYKKLYPEMVIDAEYEGKIFEESLRISEIEEETLNGSVSAIRHDTELATDYRKLKRA